MAFLIDSSYWDTINTGRAELNHSQGFFRRQHSLHEKGAEWKAKNLVEDPKISMKKKSPAATEKKNNNKQQNKACNKENVPANRAIVAISIVNKSSHTSNNNLINSSKQCTSRNVLKKSISLTSSSTNIHGRINNNNDRKVLTKSVSVQKLTSATNKLYEQAEIQKKRKEVLAKKLKAEAEKECKFQFHAKPVPKFVKQAPSLQTINIMKQTQISKQNTQEEKKKLIKQKSMPNINAMASKKCGGALVPSCGDPERIKAIQEHKKQLLDKYKPENVQFKAKPANVLAAPVFQPKHNFKPVDAKPFKLVLTQRMMQRSTFDRQLQETQAIKLKQREIMQRQQDAEERRIMRQKTEFKARPNPFGHY